MSYSLTPYLIDLEKLRKCVGTGNTKLAEKIIRKRSDEFDDDVDPDDEEIPLSQALRELNEGSLQHPESAHQYGYALEVLASHIGQRLTSHCWCDMRWVGMELTGMEKVFDESGPPVSLPPNPGDFPAMAFQTRQQIRMLVEQLGDGHMTADDEDVREMMDEWEQWLRTAAKKKRDLLYFYS